MSRRPEKKLRATKKTGRRSAKKPPAKPPGKQRLQRWLAAAGFGSRRQCEEIIESGRVEVDGTIVTKLGMTVDPSVNKVRVDDIELKQQKLVYYAVNKPVGFVTTNADPQGRSRVVDLVPNSERVFPVGRLDRNSEGLLLLTNDGDLAQQLTHPKFGVRKVYRVTVAGKVDGETMKQMRRGIFIAEGRVRVEGAKILKSRSRSTELEIVLREGKNREIRRILARLGHKVQHLRRIAVGPLRLGDLPAGAYRPLTRAEIQKLKSAVDQAPAEKPKRQQGRSAKTGAKHVKPTDAPRTKGKPARKPFQTKRSGSGQSAGPAQRGAVIGGDSDQPDQPIRKPRPGKKTSPKKTTGKQRSLAGRARGVKKSKGKPAASGDRRGSRTRATKKTSKRRPSRKGRRSKD